MFFGFRIADSRCGFPSTTELQPLQENATRSIPKTAHILVDGTRSFKMYQDPVKNCRTVWGARFRAKTANPSFSALTVIE